MDKILEPWVKCGSEVSLENQSSLHSSGCTRCETMLFEWNATRNKALHVHVESTREFLRTTKCQRIGNDVTRRKQRHSQRDAQPVTSSTSKRERANWTCHI